MYDTWILALLVFYSQHESPILVTRVHCECVMAYGAQEEVCMNNSTHQPNETNPTHTKHALNVLYIRNCNYVLP